ncbi:hypothetical protein [Burkholderia vietnamiensis]|uniref:hypothetical protein n=1 Tax=Burkholderia vietnamiensis TaxID=60552 RepID=UPI000AFC9F7C|nr:hypothetical protein [Burkholderia vietnamiensis]
MLIREARDFTKLDDAALDRALGQSFPARDESSDIPIAKSGGATASYRYVSALRAPQAGAIQSLENRVAKLLGRPAHLIVIKDATQRGRADPLIYLAPASGLKRHAEAEEIDLGYDNDWPTYSDFLQYGKFDIDHPWHDQPALIKAFGWQWGCLWDRAPDDYRQRWCRQFRQIPRQWLSYWCERANISEDLAMEALLPLLVRKMSEQPGLIDRWTSKRSLILGAPSCVKAIEATVPYSNLVGPAGWDSIAEVFTDIFLDGIELPDDPLPEICRSSSVTANQL